MNFKLKNFNVRFFNNDINNSYNHSEKYRHFEEYRKNLTEFVDCNITPSDKSIVVLGSGKLNDINLGFLCGKFDDILLTDVDKNSIKDGISLQLSNVKDINKINIYDVDYTSISDIDFFVKLEQLINGLTDIDSLLNFINKTISDIDTDNVMSQYKNSFDIVYVSPIYTQLFYTQTEIFLHILRQYKLYSDSDINKLDIAFKKCMNIIISNFNNLILSLVKIDGKIFMITDIIEIQKDDIFNDEIKQLLNKTPLDIKKLEKHITKRGLAFGRNGRRDLLDKITVIDELYAHWPFDEYKDYLVYGVCGKIKR